MKVVDYCVCCDSRNILRRPTAIAPFVAKRIHGWLPTTITINKKFRMPMPIRADSIFCLDCGFLFCDWRYDDDELGRLYKDYRGTNYTEEREMFEPGYKNMNEKLGKSPDELHSRRKNLQDMLREHMDCNQVKTVLDYGGDEGRFIPDCLWGADKFVFDISNKPTVEGVTKITDIATANLYDFVMCCHVLEHCSYPRQVVRDIKSHVARHAYFEVPLERENSVRPDYVSEYHEHINKFDIPSLSTLLKLEGFEILDIRIREMISVFGSKNIMALCKIPAHH